MQLQPSNHPYKGEARITGECLQVAVAFLLGAALRLAHLAFIDLSAPFHLGGLFVEFSRQIAAAGYRLPPRIPFYTAGGIPFAYPPPPFYVEALLPEGLGLQEFAVTNLLPPLVSPLALPAFYLLALRLRLSSRVRLAALLAYATLPAAFVQQLEGGGLAEAFGSLTLLGLASAAVRAYCERTLRSHLLLAPAWALCALSSPGSAYAALPAVLVLALAGMVRERGEAPAAGPHLPGPSRHPRGRLHGGLGGGYRGCLEPRHVAKRPAVCGLNPGAECCANLRSAVGRGAEHGVRYDGPGATVYWDS